MDFHGWRQGKGRGQGTRSLSQAKFQQNIFMAALRLSYWLSCLAQLVSASWRKIQSPCSPNSECYLVAPRLCCFLATWNNWPNVTEAHDPPNLAPRSFQCTALHTSHLCNVGPSWQVTGPQAPWQRCSFNANTDTLANTRNGYTQGCMSTNLCAHPHKHTHIHTKGCCISKVEWISS